jgi:RimJ/RimL family protein N-acetyltransferase
MRIRAALPGDVPLIVAIEQIPQFRSYIGAWSAEEHLRAMVEPDTEYFVVTTEEQDAVEGFAILQGIRSEHHSLHLKRIAVRTPSRGLGRALLDFIADRAFLHHHAHRLWLDVFETNTRARHIYEAYGFHDDGVLREAILRDGEYYTLALMSLLDREYTARQQQRAGTVTFTSRP